MNATSTAGPRRLLAVYAHPDDAELWAGGTLLAHRAAGDHTAICVLTHADSSRAGEARRGAALLGVSLYHLALPDRAVQASPAAVKAVAAVVRQERPQILLTHWADDWHPDHAATWEIARRAVMLAEAERDLDAIFWSDTYNGLGLHGLFEPDSLIDVSAVWEAKVAAIRAHESQDPAQLVASITRQCAAHGARGAAPLAEGFRRVPVFGAARRATETLWEHC